MKRFLLFLLFVLAVPTLAWADDDEATPKAKLPRAGTTIHVPPVPPVPPTPPTPRVAQPAPRPRPNPQPRAQVVYTNDDGDDDEGDEDSDDQPSPPPQEHGRRHMSSDDVERLVRDAQDTARRELERAEKELGTQLGAVGREAIRAAREALSEQNQQMNEQVRDIQRMAREQARQAIEQAREALEQADKSNKGWKFKYKNKHCEDGDCDPPTPPMAPMPPMPPMPPAPPRPPRAVTQHRDGSAVLPVGGPVAFHLETLDGDVEIVAMSTNQIQLSGPGCAPANVRFEHAGEDVEADLDVNACHGPLKVTIPTGSEVHVNTTSGSISLRGAFADVQLQAVSGDVSVDHAANAEISTVNGDVVIRDATGRVKAETVSGDAKISMSSPSPRLQFQSTSGDLHWSGLCAKGCRLETDLYSGDVVLELDARSSFSLKFASQSGDFDDDMGVGAKDTRGSATRASYGRGEGGITIQTFSGDLRVTRR